MLSKINPEGSRPDRPDVLYVPLEELAPSRTSVRRWEDEPEESRRQLVESVRAHGVLQPLLGMRQGNGVVVVAGHRRLAAAIEAHKEGGPAVVPVAIVPAATAGDRQLLAFIENELRRPLSPHQRSVMLGGLLRGRFKGDQAPMARALCMARSALSRSLSVAALPQPVLDAYGSPDHVREVDASTLTPLLRDHRETILARAADVIVINTERAADGLPPLPRSEVTRRLVRGLRSRAARARGLAVSVRDDGADLVHVHAIVPRGTPAPQVAQLICAQLKGRWSPAADVADVDAADAAVSDDGREADAGDDDARAEGVLAVPAETPAERVPAAASDNAPDLFAAAAA